MYNILKINRLACWSCQPCHHPGRKIICNRKLCKYKICRNTLYENQIFNNFSNVFTFQNLSFHYFTFQIFTQPPKI